MHLAGFIILSAVCGSATLGGPVQYEDDHHHSHYRSKRDVSRKAQPAEVDWWRLGQDDIAKFLRIKPEWGVAKNVIMFVGDGMGITTETTTRFLMAQAQGLQAHEATFSWDNMPYTGLSKTYNTDMQVPDSAGTATAIFCGEKARAGVIGVNQRVLLGNCSTVAGNEIDSILHHSIKEGKWTGVVTTTRVTHATPASVYAHTAERGWEVDRAVPEGDRDACPDIAKQLIHDRLNSQIRVIMGGGRRFFLDDLSRDPEYPEKFGVRSDERNLIEDWKQFRRLNGLSEDEFKFVFDNKTFFDVDTSKVDYLLGLFEPSHMKYEVDRADDKGGEPSLTAMVQTAIEILRRGDKGYFLAVEGGRIDHAHHETNAHRALWDAVEMGRAVQKAMDMTSASDTLIIVTADHSHAFTFNGYPSIHNDIFGVVDSQIADDVMPYLSLSYANGPGFYHHRLFNDTYRKNLTGVKTNEKNFKQDAAVPLDSETHGGEDVAIHARGPLAHLLTGVHEQHYIGQVAMYASCVGPNKGHCSDATFKGRVATTSSAVSIFTLTLPWSLACCLLMSYIFQTLTSVVRFI